MRFFYSILIAFLLSGCAYNNSVQYINGQYVDNGTFYKAQFILLIPEKKISEGITSMPLYGKVGETESGNYYWEKVTDSTKPPTFKKNKLWPID